MRGRLFEVAWQESDTPETLKRAYQKERDPEVRTRLHGLWLLRCGWSLRSVAEALGIHYRSVQRWVAWYRQGGLAPLAEAAVGKPGVRCGSHGPLPERLGDSRLDRTTV